MMAASALLVWIAAFLLQVATFNLTNDHFDRISRARQIAQYGDLPFRDFFDPGYFMTILSSAALQRLLGDSLLADILLDAAFIASGAVIVLLLARRVSGSLVVALIASLFAVLTLPRLYDFDKVLFYPLGLLLCWRYIERRTMTRLGLVGAGLVAGALFRYDTGVYIGAAATVAMSVVHWREWKVLAQRLAVFTGAVVCAATPFLLFVHFNGGILNAADQVVTYARRERERTRISSLPRFSVGELVTVAPPTPVLPQESGWILLQRAVPLLRLQVLPGSWHYRNASAFLYYELFALPVVAVLVILCADRVIDARQERARILSLAVMCVALDLFVLRSPVGARIGGMIGPHMVLGAWLTTRVWGGRRWLTQVAVMPVFALTIWAVSVATEWDAHLRSDRASMRRLQDNVRVMAAAPPSHDLMAYPPLPDLVRYLRECTKPEDRVYASWFFPELYFYAQRGFAAGMVVTFGGHWSEPRYEERMVDIFASQSVPVVIIKTHSQEEFRDFYPAFDRYLQTHYRPGGESDFGHGDAGPGGYRLLVRKDRTPVGVDSHSSLPCFAQR